MRMTRYHSLFCLGLGISALASSACSVVMDGDRVQCKVDSDCTAWGPEFAGNVCSDSVCRPDPTWACLDEVSSEEIPSGTVHVKLTAADLLSQKPVPGVHLTLCSKLDADCRFPLGQFQSDPAGQLDVELPAGFDGYFQTEGDGIYPTLFFPPNTRKQRAPSSLPMVPSSFFASMFSGIGASVSSDRTVIMTTATDCLGRPAAGMALASNQIDDRSVTYVLQGGLPSRTASTTDQDGAGGFVNIKAGGAVVTSTIAATNRVAGTVGVQTRPGHVTMVLVTPSGG
jgi:hypothetical protein